MSTRAWLGIRNMETGTVTAIYCHSENYPDYQAKNLAENWTDLDLVQKLMTMGDASFLGREFGRKIKFDTFSGNGKPGSYEKSPIAKGWSRFYVRDRNEPWDHCAPRVFESVPAYIEAFKDDENCDIEYIYLFQADADDNWEWYVFWCGKYQEEHEGFKPEGFMRCTDVLDFKARLKARAEGYNEEADPAA